MSCGDGSHAVHLFAVMGGPPSLIVFGNPIPDHCLKLGEAGHWRSLQITAVGERRWGEQANSDEWASKSKMHESR